MKYKSRYLFVVGFLSFVFVTRGRETCEMIDADCVHTHAACVSGQLWHLPRVQPEVFLITFTTTCTVAPTPGTTLHYTHTHTQGFHHELRTEGNVVQMEKKVTKKKVFCVYDTGMNGKQNQRVWTKSCCFFDEPDAEDIFSSCIHFYTCYIWSVLRL